VEELNFLRSIAKLYVTRQAFDKLLE